MDQLVCNNRTKDDGRKWKYKKQFKYKVKKNIFLVRMIELWSFPPQRFSNPAFLETLL